MCLQPVQSGWNGLLNLRFQVAAVKVHVEELTDLVQREHARVDVLGVGYV